MERALLTIEGMTCANCVKHVERALGSIDGVTVQKADIGSAEVAYDESRVERKTLTKVLEAAGYKARVDTAARADSSGCCGCSSSKP